MIISRLKTLRIMGVYLIRIIKMICCTERLNHFFKMHHLLQRSLKWRIFNRHSNRRPPCLMDPIMYKLLMEDYLKEDPRLRRRLDHRLNSQLRAKQASRIFRTRKKALKGSQLYKALLLRGRPVSTDATSPLMLLVHQQRRKLRVS